MMTWDYDPATGAYATTAGDCQAVIRQASETLWRAAIVTGGVQTVRQSWARLEDDQAWCQQLLAIVDEADLCTPA